MSTPLVDLLTARRFAPLFATQFLGAFNDNMFKSALAMLLTFRSADSGPIGTGSLVMLAGAVFIAPFILASGPAGRLADSTDKARIARWVKAAEIPIMGLAAIGLMQGGIVLCFIALFLLGLHSTVFGPVKYALLPQHLAAEELVAGNALVEGGTFIAILLGTLLGASLTLQPEGAGMVAWIGVAAAMLGWLAARWIPSAPPETAHGPMSLRLWRDTRDSLMIARHRPELGRATLAISWFWAVGATFLSGLPGYAKDSLGTDEAMVTPMLATFAIGIGLGAIAAERLQRRGARAWHVPSAAIAMAFFATGLMFVGATRLPAGENAPWGAFVCLAGMAIAGGAFSVPLYAALQRASRPGERARVIAANNILNALAMVAAALTAAGLLGAGLPMHMLFGLCGLSAIAVATWMARMTVAREPGPSGRRLRNAPSFSRKPSADS
jgi:MFS family permease